MYTQSEVIRQPRVFFLKKYCPWLQKILYEVIMCSINQVNNILVDWFIIIVTSVDTTVIWCVVSSNRFPVITSCKAIFFSTCILLNTGAVFPIYGSLEFSFPQIHRIIVSQISHISLMSFLTRILWFSQYQFRKLGPYDSNLLKKMSNVHMDFAMIHSPWCQSHNKTYMD